MLPGQQLTVESVLKLLRRNRWLFIVPLFVGVLGGLLYSRSQPSLYRSDAVIQVVPQRVPESYVSATVTERVEDRLRALAQQVLSRTQLEKLITEFDLFPRERQRLPLEDVVVLMQTKRILIEPLMPPLRRRGAMRQSEAFRVSFDYENPAVAQKVAEKLASFFIDTNARERGSQADQTSAFLEAQMSDARTRLEAQEKKLKDFRERNSGRLPTQVQANMQAIQNAQLALQAMVQTLARDRDRKLVLERFYTDAAAEAEAAATAPSSSAAPGRPLPANATPRQRLDAARTLLAQLETRLSAKHPDVVRTRRAVEDLEKQVAADELQRPVSSGSGQDGQPATQEEARRREQLRAARTEIESLERQIAFNEGEERRLRAQIDEYQARLEAVPGVESEWIALTRDYDTLQETYRQLLAKSENSKMAANLEQRAIGEQFRILDPARVPLKPHSPDRPRINLVGTLAGLGLGLLLLGFTHYRDSTMRSEDDALGAFKLPVLVLVPLVGAGGRCAGSEGAWSRLWRSAPSSSPPAALVWYLQLWKFIL